MTTTITITIKIENMSETSMLREWGVELREDSGEREY